MPLKLSTTIGKIQNLPNIKNIEIVNEFLEYMRNNGSSEHHQNNNLKAIITFGTFIGNDNSFLDINKKEQILEFLGFYDPPYFRPNQRQYRKLLKSFILQWRREI
jgi:integrase/recombinase XerD